MILEPIPLSLVVPLIATAIGVGRSGNVALHLEPQYMHKLQETIDRLFGDIDQKPVPQSLSDLAIQRDQAFVETVGKIERLKEARLRAHAPQQ